ncbi:hypothetical protein CRE_16938 [Caenorhabditis remanei]|uniref:Uncharacterized protein n=1 Tax=Caenorhabditis remanei TaxID=31234 RepID=E3N2C4_CAERE|nr:hypothetical protein CRE_16938 [Caenorhabditis remanei]
MDPNPTLDYYTWATNAGARAFSGDDCLVLKAELDKPMVVDVQSCTSNTQFPAYTVLCGVEAWNYRTGK